jgi:hypothetical protein
MRNPPNDAVAFAEWLADEGACEEARVWQEGKSLSVTWESCDRGDWLEWLLSACNYKWTAPLYAEYERQRATLYAEYQRQRAPTIRELIPYPFTAVCP